MEHNKYVEEIIIELKEKPIIKEVLDALKAGLPKKLVYHTVEHTEDVLHEAILFSIVGGELTEREIKLLAVAAAFHDMGYLKQEKDNEKIAAKEAVERMARYGYTDDEIELVRSAIEDTIVVEAESGVRLRRPGSQISRYLLDADLSNFGRDDFMEKLTLVYKESGEQDYRAFLEKTRELLEKHDWHTDAARVLRENQKVKNIQKLGKELQSGSSPQQAS